MAYVPTAGATITEVTVTDDGLWVPTEIYNLPIVGLNYSEDNGERLFSVLFERGNCRFAVILILDKKQFQIYDMVDSNNFVVADDIGDQAKQYLLQKAVDKAKAEGYKF